jgi:hypothetical protein
MKGIVEELSGGFLKPKGNLKGKRMPRAQKYRTAFQSFQSSNPRI